MDFLQECSFDASDGTFVGPRPQNEEHRKQLQVKIEQAMQLGYRFCVIYLSEYIYFYRRL
jgi:hypothetical protein